MLACVFRAVYYRETFSCALSSSMMLPPKNLRGYYPQFTDKETEAQSEESTYSWQVAKPEFQPTFSCLLSLCGLCILSLLATRLMNE